MSAGVRDRTMSSSVVAATAAAMSVEDAEDAERRKDAVRAALDTYLFAQHPLTFPVCSTVVICLCDVFLMNVLVC